MKEKELLLDYVTAIYQNCSTAIQSLEDIIPKVEDDKFKKLLAEHQDSYCVIADECKLFAKSENLDKIKDNNIIEKTRLWASINISTLTDKTNRKISEMLLFGTFMGIITCIKDAADHENVSSDLDEILDKLKNLEKKNLKEYIPYLS